MLQYRSNYPNHVHQLMVSASRHCFAGADDLMKCQKKPMEVTLAKLPASPRRHAVIYTLRDHCSGVFYAEVAIAPDLLPLKGFLARAWDEKANFAFCGLPELLSFPASVRDAFPEVAEAVERLGVRLVDVTSGFQGGVRDIREINEAMRVHEGRPLSDLPDEIEWTYRRLANAVSRRGFGAKIEMWKEGVGTVRFPPLDW
ncbi:MAG TPA: hypothetical protein VMR06_12875 [Dokdonella sp.]|uniref:hypothetical protein n=1 Tax=Dokdonella sp. TaxID=2291710 RepID=UPI002C689E73|nr:hypothetical protein [Dokdonella sp.]HUD42877.1 hypothetical protein [Dokdonella sp.]